MNNNFDDALTKVSLHILKFVKNNKIIALGSGHASATFAETLSMFVRKNRIKIKAVPTSSQIKMVVEKNNYIQLIESDNLDEVDIMFDGADQIDKEKNLVKGRGGALLMENILMNMSKNVIIIADESKFVNKINIDIPIEIHKSARSYIMKKLIGINGKPTLRTNNKRYPIITENGNMIIDCGFGIIEKPQILLNKMINIPGVLEVGIFKRKPDIIYKANLDGSFNIL